MCDYRPSEYDRNILEPSMINVVRNWSGKRGKNMTAIETDVAQCNGCGAPLLGRPTSHRPIQCEYCDLTNYLKKLQGIAPDERSEDEEVESEHYYILYPKKYLKIFQENL